MLLEKGTIKYLNGKTTPPDINLITQQPWHNDFTAEFTKLKATINAMMNQFISNKTWIEQFWTTNYMLINC